MSIPWGAVGAIGSSLIGGAFSSLGASKSNSDAKKLMRDQYGYQKLLMGQQYYRATKDMKRSGLNPLLMMGHGGAAAVPSGPTTHQPRNELEGVGAGVGKATAKAVEAATVGNIQANTLKADAEANLATAQAAETEARIPTYASNIEVNQAQIRKINTEVPKILADIDLTHQQFAKVMAEVNNVIKTGGLIDAQTKSHLASAGLTTAQISEVVPRINNLIANTAHTGVMTKKGIAEIPLSELKGAYSDIANIPKTLSRDGNSAGQVFDDYKNFFKWKWRELKDSAQNRRRNLKSNRR